MIIIIYFIEDFCHSRTVNHFLKVNYHNKFPFVALAFKRLDGLVLDNAAMLVY